MAAVLAGLEFAAAPALTEERSALLGWGYPRAQDRRRIRTTEEGMSPALRPRGGRRSMPNHRHSELVALAFGVLVGISIRPPAAVAQIARVADDQGRIVYVNAVSATSHVRSQDRKPSLTPALSARKAYSPLTYSPSSSLPRSAHKLIPAWCTPSSRWNRSTTRARLRSKAPWD